MLVKVVSVRSMPEGASSTLATLNDSVLAVGSVSAIGVPPSSWTWKVILARALPLAWARGLIGQLALSDGVSTDEQRQLAGGDGRAVEAERADGGQRIDLHLEEVVRRIILRVTEAEVADLDRVQLVFDAWSGLVGAGRSMVGLSGAGTTIVIVLAVAAVSTPVAVPRSLAVEVAVPPLSWTLNWKLKRALAAVDVGQLPELSWAKVTDKGTGRP